FFLGCGFAAKYLEGGGNFSVPLQWMLGLRRLKLDAVWVELLPATKNPRADRAKIDNFQRQLRAHGLGRRYCLLYQHPADDGHELDQIRCIGISKRELLDRLAGPNVLLNLSYSIHPPLLLEFERRIFCDLDPSEIFYWMTKLEMGQSYHDEFWTIGLNVHGRDCRLPKTPLVAASLRDARTRPTGPRLQWKTFYPLVDTKLYRQQPRPAIPKFTTIGQWYWGGTVEVDGEFPDLSKKFAFEQYVDLPSRVTEARFELAMNMSAADPERRRLQKHGWRVVDPHRVVRTPSQYRRYVASALAEFTAIKGVDVAWRTGWLSDRAAAFLASGRPVITEDTGAAKYLPRESGFHFVTSADEAIAAAKSVLADWPRHSKQARRCAVEVFDAPKNLRRLLDL
ncbi:MAG TPA: hypothetical protein VFO30_04590, partial [Chthoniobacterales bacterium]|nr:hypothetical protein [Chthoniobacterales bacterium]